MEDWQRVPCKFSDIALNNSGYATVRYKGKPIGHHCLVWILANGPIPKGMDIRHLCGERDCIELTHLLPGSRKENMQDTIAMGIPLGGDRHNAAKTHCPKGHEYTPENTIVRYKSDYSKHRECRICKNDRQRIAWRERNWK